MKLNYYVRYNDNFNTVHDVLKNYFCVSSRLLLKLRRTKNIFLNDLNTFSYAPVKPNDLVSFKLDFEEDNSNIVSTKMDLDIIYEDDALLIVNKPPYTAVHPSMQHYSNSLSNGVKFYFDKIGLKKKIRIVNRLDRDTSGIVIFAKNEYVQEFLINQMKNNTFIKEYLAILNGILDLKQGIIDAPIARKENSIIERCISLGGNKAVTHYKVLKEFNNLSLVEFKLETGRTHQIRVHSSYIGHPIIGDTLYGNASNLIYRQALHSYKISFIHPITRKKVFFESDLPKDIKKILPN